MNNLTHRPIVSYEIGNEICYSKNSLVFCGIVVDVSNSFIRCMPYAQGKRDYMAVLKNWTCNWDKTTMNIPETIYKDFYTEEDLKLEHLKTNIKLNNFLGF